MRRALAHGATKDELFGFCRKVQFLGKIQKLALVPFDAEQYVFLI
jgi:hypothetical protein